MAWDLIAATVGLIVLAWLVVNLAKIRDRSLTVLCLAIWARLFSAAFPDVTYPQVAAGLSINALLSLATIGVMFLFVDLRRLTSRYVVAVYLLMLTIILSGLANGDIVGIIEPLSKWFYFLGVAFLARAAMDRVGAGVAFRLIAISMLMPVILQVVSIALDHPKGADLGVSELGAEAINYIGGYDHESTFSLVLLTFLFVTINARPLFSTVLQIGAIIWTVLGMVYANYRTTIVAAAPALAGAALTAVTLLTPRHSRAVVLFAGLAAAIGAAFFVPKSYVERFSDIPALVTDIQLVGQRPEEFTDQQRALLTGRVYIWSQYLHAFARGDVLRQAVGQGPNAWEGRFTHYAHNTFVSQLFEYGVFGLLALTGFFIAITADIIDNLFRRETRFLLTFWLGFLTLNLATMPLWQIEGIIFIGLIAAAAWARPRGHAGA